MWRVFASLCDDQGKVKVTYSSAMFVGGKFIHRVFAGSRRRSEGKFGKRPQCHFHQSLIRSVGESRAGLSYLLQTFVTEEKLLASSLGPVQACPGDDDQDDAVPDYRDGPDKSATANSEPPRHLPLLRAFTARKRGFQARVQRF